MNVGNAPRVAGDRDVLGFTLQARELGIRRMPRRRGQHRGEKDEREILHGWAK